MSFKRRLVDKFRLFSTMALLSLMIVACGSSGVHGQVNNGKITICHAIGSANNPFNETTIDFNGLRGHSGHKSDIIPAPENGCASVPITPTVTATLAGDNAGQITICHATGSTKNPFVLITVSVNGLNGHGGHPRAVIPAPSGGCPQ